MFEHPSLPRLYIWHRRLTAVADQVDSALTWALLTAEDRRDLTAAVNAMEKADDALAKVSARA